MVKRRNVYVEAYSATVLGAIKCLS